jgi:hypothetical protein
MGGPEALLLGLTMLLSMSKKIVDTGYCVKFHCDLSHMDLYGSWLQSKGRPKMHNRLSFSPSLAILVSLDPYLCSSRGGGGGAI